MRTILLLEDDKNLNRGITLRLEREGYRVLPALCIAQARKLITDQVDLIISDITLPDGSGLEFGRRMRESSNVYLIYLTALDQELDIVNGYDSGADDYITKPFSLLVLLSKVQALMRRMDEKAGSLLSSGNLTLHLETMQVIRDGEILMLSRREFQILQLLMENAGQIVSKEQILQRVWDIDGNFVDENTVAVNISRLKGKLGTQALRNVRGVGYLWAEGVTRK